MPSTPPLTFGFASSPPKQTTKIDDSTPYVAASDGDLVLLQQSLAHLSSSSNVNITDTNGLTPLHSASSYNQIEVMKWLFTQNADVNARDSDGDTSLHHCDNLEAVKVLIEEGHADCAVRNNAGHHVLEAKEEELREYFATTRAEDVDSDDEDIDNLKKIITYLRGISVMNS